MPPISPAPAGTDRHAAAIKSTQISMVVNFVLSAIQIVVGWVAGSFALIADGIHTLSDLVADMVVLLAARHSRQGADEDHHYGHARFENAASLVLGVLLLLVGLGMTWSAIVKFSAAGGVAQVGVIALWIAGLTLVAKELLFRYLLAVARRIGSNMLIANAWHARSDALSSLVVGAAIAGNLLGYPLLDPVAALIVGGMVGKMGWHFAKTAFDDLTDRAISRDEIEAIRHTVASTPGVEGVHDLRTRRMGDLAVIDVHIEVNPELNVRHAHDIGDSARQRVQTLHRVASVMVHIDPAGETEEKDYLFTTAHDGDPLI